MTQSEFRRALLSPRTNAPVGLRTPEGVHASRRFNIYRNNVAVSLTEALAIGFPAVAKLLGEENFNAIAQTYLRQFPPQSPLMMEYGQSFPAFLDTFEPLAHLPYLGDTARLELALRHSYHAKDAPISSETLSQIPPDRLDNAILTLAPAVQVVSSPWPIHEIWAFNMTDGPKPQSGGQCVLILRPDYDPEPYPAPAGSEAFVKAIHDDHTLEHATHSALEVDQEFDLGTVLTILLKGNGIVRATLKRQEETQ